MAYLDLSNLQFGALAAEREWGAKPGTFLSDYFVESLSFRRAWEGEKLILLGNRGAGKSAIFQMVAYKEKVAGNIVVSLSPDDYSYQMLTEIMRSGQGDSGWANIGAYAAAWKHLLLIEIMKQLRPKMGGNNGKLTQDERKLKSFLRDNYANMSDTPLDALISYVRRMESVKVGSLEAGVKTRELTRLYKLEELDPYVPVIVRLSQRTRVSIFVDELDLGWDGSEDAKAFVAGLFQACHAINRLSPGRIRVYVSLRQELYSSIPAIYQDAQKYRDLFELITWTTEDLRTLIASRIRHFVPALRHETDDTCWRTVFNDTRAFKYMIDRSLHRPRELILFATYALDHARARGALGAMSIQDLLLTETDYSRERANDIVAEYQFEYPGLDSVLTWFQGRALWERDRLEMLCLELVVGEKAVSDLAATWVHSSDPERVIEALWRVGFLQAEMEAGARASGVMRTVGSHEDPNHNVAASVQFRVHPMFHAYLGIPSPVQV